MIISDNKAQRRTESFFSSIRWTFSKDLGLLLAIFFWEGAKETRLVPRSLPPSLYGAREHVEAHFVQEFCERAVSVSNHHNISNHGNPQPSCLGVTTIYLVPKTLHSFMGCWGPKEHG